MKHIEASKKIVIANHVDAAQVKYSLVQRLRTAFHVETVGEGAESFTITAAGRAATYAFTLGVSLKAEKDRVRVMICGQNELRFATKIFYVLSLLMVLVLGIFSDTTNATGSGGVAMNAMFFLLVGGFIIYDHSSKMGEPQEILDRVLDSLEAEFG